ncbi:MAG: glycine C-acetyltransferase [Candidatus Micrarchaeota archaeon]|nr:glycine C-acetyltransferase [Candidatus Micrarchaeota archaeon]
MSGKLDEFLALEVKTIRDKNLEWKLRELQGPSVPRARVNGKDVIMFCSNNYLGLSNRPELKKAAIEAVEKYGAGSGSVRAIAGSQDLHFKLERTIAHFKHTEAAIYFQTGFAANAGALPQLVVEGDLAISDALNHGSIIDGVRLSKCERAIFKHKDMEDLERVLKEAKAKSPAYNKIFIITDGVFSMDGDIAPLDKIHELAQQYGAYVYVDDAHGDGVLGDHGRGIVSHFKLEKKIECDMGTFSKGFGVVGGSIAGSQHLYDFLQNKARTWLLSGSAPPATVAACTAALELLERDDSLVRQLWDNTTYFKKEMQSLGFNTGESETPITPIMLGESKLAQEFATEIFNEGVFALPIVFPMVAQGKARIRVMVTAAHTKDDLNDALAIFEKVGKKLSVLK